MICHVRSDNITLNEVHHGILFDRRETEQTSRVSALAGHLPEEVMSCCFYCLFIKLSVVMIFR